jgi:YggT family protein
VTSYVFLYAAQFVDILVQVLTTAIFLRAILSWFVPPGSDDIISRLLHDITDPVLNPLRRVLPQMGVLDLAPLVAMVVLQVVGNISQQTLRQVAYALG